MKAEHTLVMVGPIGGPFGLEVRGVGVGLGYNIETSLLVWKCLLYRQGKRAKARRIVATVRQSTGTVLVYGCGESIHQ